MGYHPLFNAAKEAEMLGIYTLDYVRKITPFFFEVLIAAIGVAEFTRAVTGWVNPIDRGVDFSGKAPFP